MNTITIANGIAKIQQIWDEKERITAYINDIKWGINNLDIQSASAKAALECYDQQFKFLLRSIKKKKVIREEAQCMFNEIKSGTVEAATILGIFEAKAKEFEKQYRAALIKEEKNLQRNSKELREIEVKEIHKVLRKAQYYCNSLQAITHKISKQKKSVEQLLLEQQAELNISFAEI